jgi:hypothetical protein
VTELLDVNELTKLAVGSATRLFGGNDGRLSGEVPPIDAGAREVVGPRPQARLRRLLAAGLLLPATVVLSAALAIPPSFAQTTPAVAAVVALMKSPDWIRAQRNRLHGDVDVYVEQDSSPASQGIDTSALTRRVLNYTLLVNGAARDCGANIRFPGTKSPVPSRAVIFGELPNPTGGAILAFMLPAVQMVAGVSATISTHVLDNAVRQIGDNGISITTLKYAEPPDATIVLWDANRLDDSHHDALLDLGIFSGLTGILPTNLAIPGSGTPFSYLTSGFGFDDVAGDKQSHTSNVCGGIVVLKTICGDQLPGSDAEWEQGMSLNAAACLPNAAIMEQFRSLDSDTAEGK